MYEIAENIDIKDLIYEVRGVQVMLDSDLAILYGCANGTKTINLAVKRNTERFPENFYFQLTEEEFDKIKCNSNILRFQIETAKVRSLPYAFTEQGVAMLSSVLRTKDAARVSVNIMNAFVAMRVFINENKDIFKRMITIENKTDYIENSLIEQKIKIEELFDKFDRKEDFKSKLFHDGQFYDAYSFLVDIIGKANKKIIIIDNYVDKVTLDILTKKKINVTVLLITDEKKNGLTKTDVDKFNKEYPMLTVKYTNRFHDCFIILDDKELYHLGASLKDLGNKTFGMNKIEDKVYLESLKERINDICMK